ncbi:MAG: response regulator [Spirochaetales bacterium]|nr:response regulator [Spirochaetales bacterium]
MPRHKILIVDDQDFICDILIRFVSKAGFEAITASNGLEAIELYKMESPALVISDIIMPKMNGLSLLSEIKKIDPQALVILITGYGNEEILLKALRGGAINFFRKPFRVEEVIEVVTHAVRHKSAHEYKELVCPDITEDKKSFTIPVQEANILPIVNQIAINCGAFFSPSEIINIKIGIEEMFTNAVEHGSLGIGFDTKRKGLLEGNFYSLLKKKMEDPVTAEKKIHITTHLTPQELIITIKDEGEGFDWKNLPVISTENIQHFNGRGILLTKIFFDRVEYNKKGNMVTLGKAAGQQRKENKIKNPLPQRSKTQS